MKPKRFNVFQILKLWVFKRPPVKSGTFLLLGATFGASQVACVTVNVNFPESAVQEATDDYVKDLYRAKKSGEGLEGNSKADQSHLNLPWMKGVAGLIELSLLRPEIAQAQGDLNFTVNSAKANAIKSELRSNVGEVIKLKKKGVLGETAEGTLVLRDDGSQLSKIQKKKAEKVIEKENQLRSDLYNEVVRSNGMSSGHLDKIRKSFSRSFSAESPSGTWIQSASGGWEQKR